MHARIDDLLSLRDGEPIDAVTATHVEQCPSCSAQLRKLQQMQVQLQSLPQMDAPVSFEQIQCRVQQPVVPTRRAISTRWVAAFALMTLSMIVLVAVRDDPGRSLAGGDPAIEPATPVQRVVAPVQVRDLVAQSRQLEHLLQKLPERPRIERVSTTATLDTIEQRIQWLDFRLSEPPDNGFSEEQARRLWRERVVLMDSLVKVRSAEGGTTF